MTHDPMFGSPDPATPYAGTSGWSGSAASRDRALDQDASGVTGHRQQVIISLLRDAGPIGLTSAELRDGRYDLGHHGNISGALSTLHKAGRISCLRMRRNRCHVYIDNDQADLLDPAVLRPFGGRAMVAYDGPMVYDVPATIIGTPGAGKAFDQQTAAHRDALKGQFPAAYAMNAERTVAELPAPYRKPVLTDDERRLIAKARLSMNRFKGAQTMPIQTLSIQALLALIDRVTS